MASTLAPVYVTEPAAASATRPGTRTRRVLATVAVALAGLGLIGMTAYILAGGQLLAHWQKLLAITSVNLLTVAAIIYLTSVVVREIHDRLLLCAAAAQRDESSTSGVCSDLAPLAVPYQDSRQWLDGYAEGLARKASENGADGRVVPLGGRPGSN